MASSEKVWEDNQPPQCAATDLNGFKNENNNLITSTGQTLDTGDNNQTSNAVSTYSTAGDYYSESGSGNTFTLNVIGSMKAPHDYIDGMRIRFFASHANTSASTVNLATLGAKDIRNASGAALIADEIKNGDYVELLFLFVCKA